MTLQHQPALQFEAVDLRHHDIGNDAAGLLGKSAPVEQRAPGFKGLHIVSERSKQAGSCLQNARIVVNKCNHVLVIWFLGLTKHASDSSIPFRQTIQ